MEVTYAPFSMKQLRLQEGTKSEAFLNVSKNEIVEGKVLRLFPLGKALLLIKGRSVIAKTSMPLAEGTVLSLKVENLAPVTTLKALEIISRDPRSLDISQILYAIKGNVWRSALKTLGHGEFLGKDELLFRELMNDLSVQVFLKSSPWLLRDLIDKSGFVWEVKLRDAVVSNTHGRGNINRIVESDLKGLASRLVNSSGKKDTVFRSLVSSLKNFQLVNHHALEQYRKIFLPIPMQFLNGDFSVGQLLIRLPKEYSDKRGMRERKGRIFRITFLLELSKLGPLRADISVMEREVEGKILVTNKQAKLLVEEGVPFLRRSISEKGFSVSFLECGISEPAIVGQTLIGEVIEEEGTTISLIA